MNNVIKFDPEKTKYEYGTKGSSRSSAVNLSPLVQEHISTLISDEDGEPIPRLRSAWVERACWLLIALQTGDAQMGEDWYAWLYEAASKDDANEIVDRMDWVVSASSG